MGFANTNRSFVSTKVAEKEYGLARKFAMWGIVANFIAVGVLSALLIGFHRKMTYFFTDVESLIPDLSFYILCYRIMSPLDGCLGNFATLCKITDQLNMQMLNATINFIFISNGLCILGFWVWDIGAFSIWLGFWTAELVSFVLFWVVLFHYTDWSQIKDLEAEDNLGALSQESAKMIDVVECGIDQELPKVPEASE